MLFVLLIKAKIMHADALATLGAWYWPQSRKIPSKASEELINSCNALFVTRLSEFIWNIPYTNVTI